MNKIRFGLIVSTRGFDCSGVFRNIIDVGRLVLTYTCANSFCLLDAAVSLSCIGFFLSNFVFLPVGSTFLFQGPCVFERGGSHWEQY